MTKWTRPAIISFVACWLVASPLARAQKTEKTEAPPPALTIDDLEAQIDIAEKLHAMALTPEQIAQFRKLTETVTGPRRKLQKARNGSEVRTVLVQARDAALTGKAESAEGTPSPLAKYQEEWKQTEDTIEQAVTSAVEEAGRILKPAQLARLTTTYITPAHDMIGAIADHRGAEPDPWRDWRDDACHNLAAMASASGNAEPPADALKSLVIFCNRLRNMPTDDFFNNRAALTGELDNLIAEIVAQNMNAERKEAALNSMKAWFNREGFPDTLNRLAELKK